MGRRWPESGTWVVVPTSATADWDLVATSLAAAASARVAVVAVGTGAPPGARLLTHIATWADLRDGGADPLRLVDALKAVDAIARTHDLVLVIGAAGLVVPMGRIGWTMVDLAAALGAPVVVVVGEDPRGVNYTTVEALESRGLASALVTVGDAPKQLPVEPSGRLPAGLAELDPEAARGFLDPRLHAKADSLPSPAAPRPGPSRSNPAAGSGWPGGGPWVVVPAGPAAETGARDVDWESAVTALAAASTARVAAVAIGTTGPPAERLAAHLGSWIGLHDGGKDPLRLADALAVVGALGRTHELVLVIGVASAVEPAGRAGWTLVDLAAALGAPVVVVTADNPDGGAAAARALGTIDARGLTSAVVTVGDGAAGDGAVAGMPEAGTRPAGALQAGAPANGSSAADPRRNDLPQAAADAPPHDVSPTSASPADGSPAAAHGTPGPSGGDGLAVAPAGRIPAGIGELDADAARALLDPMLHATAAAVVMPLPASIRRPVAPAMARMSGGRAALLVVAIFVIMSLSAVGLAYCNRTTPETQAAAEVDVPEWVPPQAEQDPAALSNPCPPDRLSGEPARPSPAVTARVDAAWTRIETWLAANAPESRRSLRPPAGAAEVDAAQRRMSLAFPSDLAASLLRHDGAESPGFALPIGFRPMATAEIVETRTMLCEIITGQPDLEDFWWGRDFVPFAAAGNGDHLVADQRLGNHGRVGEFFHEDGTHFERWPASTADLLEQTATSLETGQPFLSGIRPVVEDGLLRWS